MEWSLTKGHFRVSQGVVRGAALFSCLFWFVCFVSFLMCISNKQLGFLSFFLSFFFFLWQCPTAFGILGPQPGIEPAPSALEAQSQTLDYLGIPGAAF